MHPCVTAESALTIKIVRPIELIFPSQRLLTALLRRQLLPQRAPRREPGAPPLSTLPPKTVSPGTASRTNSETPATAGSLCLQLQIEACAAKGFHVPPAHEKDRPRPSAAFSNRR